MTDQHSTQGQQPIPAGEGESPRKTTTVDEVAAAFGVDRERVAKAVFGEFRIGADSVLSARQVQHIAEVMLADQPLGVRTAAVMETGVYTPRPDDDFGLGSGEPSEESDRQAARADVIGDDLPSERSSWDPASKDAESTNR